MNDKSMTTPKTWGLAMMNAGERRRGKPGLRGDEARLKEERRSVWKQTVTEQPSAVELHSVARNEKAASTILGGVVRRARRRLR